MVQMPEGRPTSANPKDRANRSDPGDRAAAVAKGRAEAEKELHNNDAKIWTYGSVIVSSEMLDPETGLYFSSFGDSVDDDLVARVEGHNARISEYIREHGLPKNSFKPWEKELFGLKSYFENQNRIEKPIRLTVGGPEVRSPDGRYVIKLEKRTYEMENGERGEGAYLLAGESGAQANRYLLNLAETEVVWGPKGSWFAAIRDRSRMDNSPIYVAYDLRGRRPIRRELKNERPRVTASEQR